MSWDESFHQTLPQSYVETCDLCGDIRSIRDVEYVGRGRFECSKCRASGVSPRIQLASETGLQGPVEDAKR